MLVELEVEVLVEVVLEAQDTIVPVPPMPQEAPGVPVHGEPHWYA